MQYLSCNSIILDTLFEKFHLKRNLCLFSSSLKRTFGVFSVSFIKKLNEFIFSFHQRNFSVLKDQTVKCFSTYIGYYFKPGN